MLLFAPYWVTGCIWFYASDIWSAVMRSHKSSYLVCKNICRFLPFAFPLYISSIGSPPLFIRYTQYTHFTSRKLSPNLPNPPKTGLKYHWIFRCFTGHNRALPTIPAVPVFYFRSLRICPRLPEAFWNTCIPEGNTAGVCLAYIAHRYPVGSCWLQSGVYPIFLCIIIPRL